MKSKTKRKLTENELMILVFSGEFLMCFMSIILGILPIYGILSICGFCLSLWYYREQKK